MKLKNIIVLSILLLYGTIYAGVPEIFGIGSRASSMAGAYSSVNLDSNSQFYNPANLSFEKITFSYSLIDSRDDFKSPGNILISSGDSENIDNINYTNSFGNSVSFSFPFVKRVSMGFFSYIPFGNILNFVGEDPFSPQYIMYLSRNDRPIFNGNLAYNPWRGVSLGVGTFVTHNISGDMRLFIDENDTQIPSYATLNIKIKPMPYLSFGTNINFFEVFKFSKLYFFNFSLSYKQESKYKAKFNADAALSVQLASVGLNAVLSSVPYFDPETYTLGLSAGLKDRYLLSFDISYERWDRFEPGFIKLDGNFLNKAPMINFNNRIVYRFGGEYQFLVRKAPIFTRMGYAFVPSPVPDQKGDGNILDCDKNIYSIGVGLLIDKRNFFLESDLKIDLHYQLQKLNDRIIVKESSSSIGYKKNGYIAGGKIWAIGISLSVDF